MREKFVPELNKRMEADGHMVAPYGALRNVGGKREFFMEVFSPRYSHLYTRGAESAVLLVETHSLKAAKTRAWADYDIMRHSIDIILQDPQALRSAVREADREMAARAGDRSAAAGVSGRKSERPEPAAGLSRAEERSVQERNYGRDGESISAGAGRYRDRDSRQDRHHGGSADAAGIPDSRRRGKNLADELALHGVEMERTTKPLEQEFETYRFSESEIRDDSV